VTRFRVQRDWGRAFAGLALFACVSACDDGSAARGPGPASEGEAAALREAAEMLDERQPAEDDVERGAPETPAQ